MKKNFFLLGYPRLLSGDYKNFDAKTFIREHQATLFPVESEIGKPWTKIDVPSRYYLSFPCYPFRTLTPRDLVLMSLKPTDFDATSPIFPANTQIDIVFKKRNTLNYLNYLHAFQIDPTWGPNKKNITSDNRSTILTH
jgi:hypothetical protein